MIHSSFESTLNSSIELIVLDYSFLFIMRVRCWVTWSSFNRELICWNMHTRLSFRFSACASLNLGAIKLNNWISSVELLKAVASFPRKMKNRMIIAWNAINFNLKISTLNQQVEFVSKENFFLQNWSSIDQFVNKKSFLDIFWSPKSISMKSGKV